MVGPVENSLDQSIRKFYIKLAI